MYPLLVLFIVSFSQSYNYKYNIFIVENYLQKGKNMNKQNILVVIIGDKEEYKKLIQERMLDNGFCLFEGRCDLTKENTITK